MQLSRRVNEFPGGAVPFGVSASPSNPMGQLAVPEEPAPSVLVVDDSPSARQSVEALLARDPYVLTLVSNGNEALEQLAIRPFDLVISDVMMPKMDGLKLCRAIKTHAEWRFIPVILVTALDGQDDLVRGLEAGADEFLVKPVDRVVFRARVRAMLRIRSQYQELSHSAPKLDELLTDRRERLIAAAGLSEREREVLDLLLLGRSHCDIAAALGISERTSKFHLGNILAKLGAESRADLPRLFL